MKLRSQTFEYTRQLLQFVNTNLKREDIQAITHSFNMKGNYPDTSFTIFYWEEDEEDNRDMHLNRGTIHLTRDRGLPIPPELIMMHPLSTHIYPPATLPELACNWHEFWRVSGPVYMPESLGPSRIIIINSKRLYHPIRDMGRPELRIPPYIATRPPVHPCRDFRKIFSSKIPRKYPRPPEKMAPKFFRKNCEKSLSALHEIPRKAKNPRKGEQM